MARHRSPNYPTMSLEDSIKAIKKISDEAGRASMTGLEILNVLGYTTLSGASKSKFSALKKFGLVEGDYNQAKISELGVRILFPENDETTLSDYRTAALRPELFRQAYEKYGANLPSKGILKNWLVRELNFNERTVQKFIQSLQNTFEFAKVKDGDEQDLESHQSSLPMENSLAESSYESKQKDSKPQQPEQPESSALNLFATWPIGQGVQAQLSFTNKHEVTVDDLDAVCDYIEVAKKQLTRFDSPIQTNSSETYTEETD